MVLKNESDSQLLNETKNLVSHLNEKTVELLERLREIENRKLHLERGYSSLFGFVTEELGFSAAAAMRRIDAMQLMKDVPHIKAQISSGALNLTTVSQTQQLFKKESFSREAKLELLMTLENRPTREVEKELAKRNPQVYIYARVKPLSLNQNEIKFVADDELVKKLEKLKALKSHSVENMNDLLNSMADLCLDKWEPKIKSVPSPKKSKRQRDFEEKNALAAKPETPSSADEKVSVEVGISIGGEVPLGVKIGPQNKSAFEEKEKQSENFVQNKVGATKIKEGFTPAPKRYIAEKLKAAIYNRDEGRCQYVDPITGKICHSSYFLQLDHIKPFALGGQTSEANLRLYCSAHNQWRAQNSLFNN